MDPYNTASRMPTAEIMLNDSMVTTALELPGWQIVASHGVARGIVVRSRSVIGNFLGGLQSLFGGDITVYTSLCERARQDAYRGMLKEARMKKANAIIGMRYDATELMAGLTEVLCYGTAVTVTQVEPRAGR